MQTTITTFDNSAEGWERALYAFLAEKERRSGSRRTVEGYSRMLQHCFGTIGKPPDKLTSQEVFAWAYGTGLSGKQPSSVTIGARLACLSSFFHFLIRMEAITSNPCDALERPKVSVAPPRGLGGTDIQKLLAVIPETPTGLRDRAIVLTLTLTGRRRAEVLNMKVRDITHEDGKTWYRYRGKGGKTGKRELPEPAFVALTLALSAFGHDIAAMRRMRRCGRHVAATRAGSPAAPSTAICSVTSSWRGCRRPVCTSSGTPPRSSGAMQESRSRTSAGSLTTRRWRSLRST
jgi:site-specific recombinase XerC